MRSWPAVAAQYEGLTDEERRAWRDLAAKHPRQPDPAALSAAGTFLRRTARRSNGKKGISGHGGATLSLPGKNNDKKEGRERTTSTSQLRR